MLRGLAIAGLGIRGMLEVAYTLNQRPIVPAIVGSSWPVCAETQTGCTTSKLDRWASPENLYALCVFVVKFPLRVRGRF